MSSICGLCKHKNLIGWICYYLTYFNNPSWCYYCGFKKPDWEKAATEFEKGGE